MPYFNEIINIHKEFKEFVREENNLEKRAFKSGDIIRHVNDLINDLIDDTSLSDDARVGYIEQLLLSKAYKEYTLLDQVHPDYRYGLEICIVNLKTTFQLIADKRPNLLIQLTNNNPQTLLTNNNQDDDAFIHPSIRAFTATDLMKLACVAQILQAFDNCQQTEELANFKQRIVSHPHLFLLMNSNYNDPKHITPQFIQDKIETIQTNINAEILTKLLEKPNSPITAAIIDHHDLESLINKLTTRIDGDPHADRPLDKLMDITNINGFSRGSRNLIDSPNTPYNSLVILLKRMQDHDIDHNAIKRLLQTERQIKARTRPSEGLSFLLHCAKHCPNNTKVLLNNFNQAQVRELCIPKNQYSNDNSLLFYLLRLPLARQEHYDLFNDIFNQVTAPNNCPGQIDAQVVNQHQDYFGDLLIQLTKCPENPVEYQPRIKSVLQKFTELYRATDGSQQHLTNTLINILATQAGLQNYRSADVPLFKKLLPYFNEYQDFLCDIYEKASDEHKYRLLGGESNFQNQVETFVWAAYYNCLDLFKDKFQTICLQDDGKINGFINELKDNPNLPNFMTACCHQRLEAKKSLNLDANPNRQDKSNSQSMRLLLTALNDSQKHDLIKPSNLNYQASFINYLLDQAANALNYSLENNQETDFFAWIENIKYLLPKNNELALDALAPWFNALDKHSYSHAIQATLYRYLVLDRLIADSLNPTSAWDQPSKVNKTMLLDRLTTHHAKGLLKTALQDEYLAPTQNQRQQDIQQLRGLCKHYSNSSNEALLANPEAQLLVKIVNYRQNPRAQMTQHTDTYNLLEKCCSGKLSQSNPLSKVASFLKNSFEAEVELITRVKEIPKSDAWTSNTPSDTEFDQYSSDNESCCSSVSSSSNNVWNEVRLDDDGPVQSSKVHHLVDHNTPASQR